MGRTNIFERGAHRTKEALMRSRIPKEELEMLSKVPLFSQCNESELKEIAGLGTQIDVSEGKKLTTEGEPGREFFLVLEGEADCSIRGSNAAVLGPGDSFGELALLDGGSRTATITAVTPLRVVVLNAAEFSSLLRASPTIAIRLLSTLAGRLRDAQATAVY
jgi:CRP/FNR family cyclic AMP-dependent transcriptional regulator